MNPKNDHKKFQKYSKDAKIRFKKQKGSALLEILVVKACFSSKCCALLCYDPGASPQIVRNKIHKKSRNQFMVKDGERLIW